MNNGSFFRLDLISSKVEEGVVFYEFIDLPDMDAGDDGLRYPIRLTITQDRVKFFIHYFDNGESVLLHHAEEVILELPYTSVNDDALSSLIKRIYNTVFPMSDYLHKIMKRRYNYDNEKTGLENRKKEKEETLRPLEEKLKQEEKEDKNEEINRKIEEIKREYDEIEKELNIIKRYTNLKKSQINKDSYSSLYIWGLLDNPESDNSSYNIQNDKGKFTRFLRKLLLDFMFDMMHSDVFESSKYYGQMREGLMNDFFFSSIVKKSEYYYNRRLVRNRLNSIINPEDNSKYLFNGVKEIRKKNRIRLRRIWWNQLLRPSNLDVIDIINKEYEADLELIARNDSTGFAYDIVQSVKNLYAEKLDESEAEWIDVIMSPLADKHFSFSPEWYEDIIPRKKKSRFSVSESWFVNPEEEMSRIAFPLKDDVNKKVHYLNSFELGTLTSYGDISSVLQRNTKISNWFYRRLDFVDAFRIHFFKYWNHCFALLLLIFGIVAIWPEYGFWASLLNIALFPIAISAVFFITFLGLVMNLYYKNLRCKISHRKKYAIIDDLLINNRRQREILRSLGFSFFFAAIGLFLYCYNYLASDSAWVTLPTMKESVVANLIKGDNTPLIITCLVLFGMSIFLLYFFKSRIHIIDNIHIFLPRLVASITAAWIMLVIGNDIVKECLSWPIWIILSIVVFAFILYESNKTIPNIATWPRIWRALELMLISFSISLIIGIIAIDVLSPSLLVDLNDAIKNLKDIEPQFPAATEELSKLNELKPVKWSFVKENGDFTISFIPQYLIQFSFLAMFIGVFVQMIFEEKKITEM